MDDTARDQTDNKGFVKYDPTDTEYFGAATVVNDERAHILKRKGLEEKTAQEQQEYLKNDLAGLALSGGGIRSASFCLGVLQALSYKRWLKNIDYLSSVSGGGYIGASLNWLLSNKWRNADVGVGRENFPYGTYPMRSDLPMTVAEKADTVTAGPPNMRGALLRYLRQHGKYLTPGNSIGPLSLCGVLIRGTLLSLFVYFSLLVLLFSVLGQTFLFQWYTDFGVMPPFAFLSKIPNFSLLIALIFFTLFVVLAFAYSLATFVFSQRPRSASSLHGTINNAVHSNAHNSIDDADRDDNVNENATDDTAKSPPNKKQDGLDSISYQLRRKSEGAYTYLLAAVILFAVMGSIPVVYELFVESGMTKETVGLSGLISTLVGIFSSISTFVKTSSVKPGKIPVGLLVAVSTIALWFGLLLLAYHCSLWLEHESKWISLLILAGLVAIFGWLTNLNYISVHRYYRDRLMEVFMPDLDDVVEPGDTPSVVSAKADKARLSEMCRYTKDKARSHNMPYHIINTNIVLVSSKIAKFRGRGGDNFILTPAYCGSNATGWRDTSSFMSDRMTLSTAMAISGAAVNPSTGVGGSGVTRQPFLSMLMGLLNIRLGYWAPNPDPERQPFISVPNFFLPGLSEMILRKNLNEESRFVQLSDGGHFENLGLYELIRRKVRLIIACDGAADGSFKFTDLFNALEKIRADFGVLVSISAKNLEDMVPLKDNDKELNAYAKRGYIVADVLYPDNVPGKLIYIKSTFFSKLSADFYGYKQNCKEFPDEPTSDQFFDEKQFEAYRELGFQTAWEMMNDPQVEKDKMITRIFPRQT